MFSPTWLLTFFVLSPLTYVTAQADTPEMVYNCDNTPGVCTNMCFGAYCRNFDVNLHYDKPSNATKTARRKKAGCGPKNRCSGGGSPDPEGPSCDEYPFASTSNADDVQAVNRCVPTAEQNSQGGTISSFYQNQLNNNAGDFIVGFGNPDNSATQYCEYDTECNNDGNQYCGSDLCPDGKAGGKIKHKRNFYMAKSGMEFLSTRDLEVGARVVRVVKRTAEPLAAPIEERDIGNHFDFVEDKVSHQIWKE